MGTFQSIRKAYGALKDSTMVGLAKVNSDFKVSIYIHTTTSIMFCFPFFFLIYNFVVVVVVFFFFLGWKDLDIAIVKATNHVECPPKDRHVRSMSSFIKLCVAFHLFLLLQCFFFKYFFIYFLLCVILVLFWNLHSKANEYKSFVSLRI